MFQNCCYCDKFNYGHELYVLRGVGKFQGLTSRENAGDNANVFIKVLNEFIPNTSCIFTPELHAIFNSVYRTTVSIFLQPSLCLNVT